MAPLPKSASSRAVEIGCSQSARVPTRELHISPAAIAISTRTQAPVELVTHHLLTLAAMAAQRLVSVRLPTGDLRPVSCFFATFADATERRAAVEKMVLDPMRQWAHAFARSRPCITERDVKLFLNPPRADPRDRYAGYMPPSGMFARHPHELIQPRHCRREEAVSLCALWDGQMYAPLMGAPRHMRLSIHLVATPREGRAFLTDAALADSGFLGRLLCVQPASRIGARTWAAEEADTPPPEFTALFERLATLYAQAPTMDTRVVTFSPEAAAAWLAFAQEVEHAMADGGAFAAIRPFAVHMPEHAARLAVITALLENPALEELSLAALESGIALARFYADESLRLYTLAPPPVSEAERIDLLRDWLQRSSAAKEVSLRDICRRGPPAVRDADVAFNVMRRLERLGVVQPATATSQGAPRRVGGRYEWRVVHEVSQSVA